MKKPLKAIFLFCFLLTIPLLIFGETAQSFLKKEKRILIYTKNGEGFVHDNIKESAEAMKKIAQSFKYQVDITDDPFVFTEENLTAYRMVIFANTNNDVFENNHQRLAFRRFIEAGGGMMGIHSALGTERNWTWFTQMLGGSFIWHPKKQFLYLYKVSKNSQFDKTLKSWLWEDECYFSKTYFPGIQTLLVADLTKMDKKDMEAIQNHKTSFGDFHPVAWFQLFDGGVVWLTSLGHDKEAYQNPDFINHLTDGFKFLIKESHNPDFSKAYAQTFDEYLKF